MKMTSKRLGRSTVSSNRPKGSSSSRVKNSDKHSSSHNSTSHGGASSKLESHSSHSNSHSNVGIGGVGGGGSGGVGSGSGGGSSYHSSQNIVSSSRSRGRITIRGGNLSSNHSSNNSNNYNHSGSSYNHSRGSGRAGGNPGSSGGNNNGNGMIMYHRYIDPNVLAQGMSGRYLGARLSCLQPLASDELEKDLRLMDAYNAACITYAQRYFAYCNQNNNNNSNQTQLSQYEGGEAYMTSNSGGDGAASNELNNGIHSSNRALDGSTLNSQTLFSMPIRIDPEEEKRVAILRKKIAASEAKREVLETQYLSLRAHYVHESQRLRKARERVFGEMTMLRDLIQKRGDVLALRRLRCSLARNLLVYMKYRKKLNEKPYKEDMDMDMDKTDVNQLDIPMDIDKKTTNDPSTSLLSFWEKMENDIRQAENACNSIEIPPSLMASSSPIESISNSNVKQHKRNESKTKGGNDDAISISSPSSSSAANKNNHYSSHSKRSRSTPGDKGDGNVSDTSSGVTRKKLKMSKADKDKHSRKQHHANSHSSSNANANDSTSMEGSQNSKDSFSAHSFSKIDADTVPWVSQTMPMTPYGVPLLVSYLSHAPDRIMGAALTIKPNEVTLFESNLPESYYPTLLNEVKQNQNLRHEIEVLTSTLASERQLNNNLQREIINDRKRSDAMCSMMTLIRTETEAVLRRHNVILGTPGARMKAADLHKKVKEEIADAEEEEADDDGESAEESEEEEEEEEEEETTLTAPTEITVSAGGGEEEGGRLGDDNDELEDEGDELEEEERLGVNASADADADGDVMDTDEEEGEIKEDDDVDTGDETPTNALGLLNEAKRVLPDDDLSQNEVQEDDDIVDEEEEEMSMNNTLGDPSRINNNGSSALDVNVAISQHTEEDESDSAEEGEIQEDEDDEGEEGEIQEEEEEGDGTAGVQEGYQPIKEVIVHRSSHSNNASENSNNKNITNAVNPSSNDNDVGNTIPGPQRKKQPFKKRLREEASTQGHRPHSQPIPTPFDDEEEDEEEEEDLEEEEGEINEDEERDLNEDERILGNRSGIEVHDDEEEGEVHEDGLSNAESSKYQARDVLEEGVFPAADGENGDDEDDDDDDDVGGGSGVSESGGIYPSLPINKRRRVDI